MRLHALTPPVLAHEHETIARLLRGQTVTSDDLGRSANNSLFNGSPTMRMPSMPVVQNGYSILERLGDTPAQLLHGTPSGLPPADECPPAPLPNVIGLYSPINGMGKSTFAQMLSDSLKQRGRKVAIVSFAEPLRDLATRILQSVGYPPPLAEMLVTKLKNTPIAFKHPYNSELDKIIKGRDVLKATGEGCRDILGESVWVEAFESRIRSLNLGKHDFVICDDMRRLNEKEAIEDMLGVTSRLVRGAVPTTFPAIEGLLEDEEFDFEIELKDGFEDAKANASALADTLICE